MCHIIIFIMAAVINYIIWIVTFGTYNPFIQNNGSNDISDGFLLIDLNDKSLFIEEKSEKPEKSEKSTEKKYQHNIKYNKQQSEKIIVDIGKSAIKTDILNFKFNPIKKERLEINQPKPVNKHDTLVREIKQKKQLKSALIECEDGTKLSLLDNSPETTEKIMKSKLIKIQTEKPKTILDEIHEGVKLKSITIIL